MADPLITPQHSALLLIDYQPPQLSAITSMDPELMLRNAVSTVTAGNLSGVPILHSTVNVGTGRAGPTLPELAQLLPDNPAVDRTTVNAWEDTEFVHAVRATGRRKLVICALWTEIWMALTALDALRERYEVSP